MNCAKCKRPLVYDGISYNLIHVYKRDDKDYCMYLKIEWQELEEEINRIPQGIRRRRGGLIEDLCNNAFIDQDIEDLPAYTIHDYISKIKSAGKLLRINLREGNIGKHSVFYLYYETLLQKLYKKYYQKKRHATASTKEIVWTGIKGQVNYLNQLENLLPESWSMEYLKQQINYWQKGNNEDSIKTLQLLQCVAIIVARKDKDKDAVDRAIFRLHHEYQISPMELFKFLNKNQILRCGVKCVMERSENEFEKHEMPEWIKNVLSEKQ